MHWLFGERRRLQVLLLWVTFGLLGTALPAYAAEGDWATAEGMAAVAGRSEGEAKADALLDAMRNAVQEVLGTMLTSETLVENLVLVKDKILTRVEGYVKQYETLSEQCQGDECRVKIRARVEKMALADDVAALVHVLPRMNYPTLLVSFSQKELGQNLQAAPIDVASVDQAVSQSLAGKGFLVAEGAALEAERRRQARLKTASGDSLGEALETASHLAQVMVSGQAVVQDNGGAPYNDRLHSYGAFLTAKAYDTITGKLLATASAEANVPHHSFALGTQKALQTAAVQLTEALSKQIVTAWLDACYNDSEVNFIVEQVSFGAMAQLKQALAAVHGVTRVNQRSFLRGRAEIVLGWQSCNTNRLAESVQGLSVSAGRLDVLEVNGNTVRAVLAH